MGLEVGTTFQREKRQFSKKGNEKATKWTDGKSEKHRDEPSCSFVGLKDEVRLEKRRTAAGILCMNECIDGACE